MMPCIFSSSTNSFPLDTNPGRSPFLPANSEVHYATTFAATAKTSQFIRGVSTAIFIEYLFYCIYFDFLISPKRVVRPTFTDD